MENGDIFTYDAAEPLYAMHWSARLNSFRLALGTFKPDRTNMLDIVELNESAGVFRFKSRLSIHHGFPATKVLFAPDGCRTDLVATSSDALRLWKIDSDIHEEACLVSDKEHPFHQPLTSFDWVEPAYIGTCSIDRSCTIWNVERQTLEKQLIAHSNEIYDLAWGPVSGRFATVSADGSMRIFDMRYITHPAVIYENVSTPLVRVAWNRQDPRYLTVIAKDSLRVVLLDTRHPTFPVAELEGHKAFVNAMAWAPHSSCHICTTGDDGQAYIWDLTKIKCPTDRSLVPILSYGANSEITQVHWAAEKPGWIAICFDRMAQILRV